MCVDTSRPELHRLGYVVIFPTRASHIVYTDVRVGPVVSASGDHKIGLTGHLEQCRRYQWCY